MQEHPLLPPAAATQGFAILALGLMVVTSVVVTTFVTMAIRAPWATNREHSIELSFSGLAGYPSVLPFDAAHCALAGTFYWITFASVAMYVLLSLFLAFTRAIDYEFKALSTSTLTAMIVCLIGSATAFDILTIITWGRCEEDAEAFAGQRMLLTGNYALCLWYGCVPLVLSVLVAMCMIAAADRCARGRQEREDHGLLLL